MFLSLLEAVNLKTELQSSNINLLTSQMKSPDEDCRHVTHCFVCGSMLFITAYPCAAARVL
jgi:hypothetical protein